MKKVEVGDIVVFNNLPNGVRYDVLTVDGFCMTVRECGTDYKVQHSDTSLVAKIVGKQSPKGERK